MLSRHLKKNLGYLFLFLTVLPVFFVAPVFSLPTPKVSAATAPVKNTNNAATTNAANYTISSTDVQNSLKQPNQNIQNALYKYDQTIDANTNNYNTALTGTVYEDPTTKLPTTNITPTQISEGLSPSPAGAGGVTPNGAAPALTQAAVPTATGLTCTWGDVAKGDIKACFLSLLEFVFVEIPAWVFSLAGAVFDTFIALSLSSVITRNPTFVDAGWIISRDIANTFFIFILLYIAILTILQLSGGATKRLLATLVVVALLMNFSLYFTRFIIDVGNVFALEFYTKIGGNITPRITLAGLDIQPRAVSNGFANAFNINNLMGPEVFNSLNTPGTVPLLAFTFVLVGAMLLIASYVFFAAGFLFLSRLVVFWLCMIFAPLAFFSWILPSTKSMVWGQWWTNLWKSSLVAPIFLFFLYLILGLANSFHASPLFVATTGGVAGTGNTMFLKNVTVFLQFFILIALLIAALKVAKSMASAASGVMTSAGVAVAGTTLGVGLGTLAFSGRKLVGSSAKFAADRYGDKLNAWGVPGQWLNKGLQGVASSSFDIRASKMAQTLDKSIGGAAGMQILGAAGSAGGAGGYAQKAQKKEGEIQKTFDSMYSRDPNLAFKYLASQRKSIFAGRTGKRAVGDILSGARFRPDENVLAVWKGLDTKKRLEAITKSEGKNKIYFQNLNKYLEGGGYGFTSGQQISEQRERVKLLLSNNAMKEGKPVVSVREKIEALSSLSEDKPAQQELYKSLSVPQRRELEGAATGKEKDLFSGIKANLSEDDRRVIIEAEQRYDDVGIRKAKKERADDLKTIFEGLKPDGTLTDEQRATVKGHLSKMDGLDFANLDEDILTHDAVIPEITRQALAKIEKGKNISPIGKNILYKKLRESGNEDIKKYIDEAETIQPPKRSLNRRGKAKNS